MAIHDILSDALESLLLEAGEPIVITQVTRAVDTTASLGDMTITSVSSATCNAILSAYNEVEDRLKFGIDVVFEFIAYVNPDEISGITQANMSLYRVTHNSKTYEVVGIERANAKGSEVYKALLLREV
jgi:hypothetical protein